MGYDKTCVGVWVAVAVIGLACGAATDAPTGDGDSTGDGTTATTIADTDAPATTDPTSAGDTTGEGSSDDGGNAPPAGCGQGVPIQGSEQVPGDPEEGYRALLEEGYVTCGIPYSIFPLAQSALGSFADGEPLPGRTGNNANVPHNWTVHTSSSGAEIVSLNCLECHAGKFNGKLVVGLGKADADYTGNIGGSLGSIPIPQLDIPGIEELTRMVSRYQTIGDDVRMLTVGTNPADRLAAVLASHRDPATLEWFDEPQSEIPDIVLPVDTPPWWHVSKKQGLFFNGMARGDHRATMMFASSLCTDTVEEAEQILTYFNDIRAFLATVEAPTYPFAIDETLAADGQEIFERDCACCHGSYGTTDAEDVYPSLLLPLDVIGTDPLLADKVVETDLASWFNPSWYGQIGELTPDDPFPGYVAPPLDGIWATAPYLHNASVPNLALVLDSTRRPEFWRRVDYDSTNFDESSVGWPYLETAYGQDDAPEDERRFIYDATKLGHWNTGHTFGDHLTDSERAAVLEYLKTL